MMRILIGLLVMAGLVCGQELKGLRCEYLRNPLGIDVEKPRLSWVGAGQSAYRVLVASSPEKLRRDQGDVWDSGKVTSSQTAWVEYGGRPLASGERVYWKVRAWDGGKQTAWSSVAQWSMGVLKDSEWYGRVIGIAGSGQAFPWLRKNIELKQKPARATAYVNPLGYYELYVNGKKVDDHVLAPAVSDYSKRTYYVTHDITDYLTAGKNTFALWLGRGWYVKGHPGVIHDGPLVRAQFDIAMADGSVTKVGTGADWKVKASPILPLGRGTAFGDYGGERYDARLELDGWNAVSLDDSGWAAATVFEVPKTTTSAQMVEPNRIMSTIDAVKIDETPAGEWHIDMGKNFVGWLELKLPAGTEAGQSVRIDYADWKTTAPRWATFNQRDEYVTKAGAQTIRSRFNYHGFQYAHVTGLKQKPAVADVKGHFIRTSYERAGEFESSNKLLNRIYKTVGWTYENLSLGGYVVDCPTRERLGYGGDAGTSLDTGLLNFDTGGLYNRWAQNWRDAQAPSGDMPFTAPNYQDQGGGGPMWIGFVITMPWQLYQTYGDKRALEINYPMMQKWLAFADTKTVENILVQYPNFAMRMPQWAYLGDWVTPRRSGAGSDPLARHPVSAKFINNLHYLYTLKMASKIAGVLGKTQDSAAYEQRAATLSKTLHEKFYDASKGVYATGEQPYLAMPLLLNVTPNDLRDPLMKRLEEDILVKNQGHIDAGMHGTYFLLKYLMEQDRNDLIYTMATQTTFPSWGYMLDQGATTIWESWSGGSHIHDCLISIGSWFIEGIGGIRMDELSPGFRHYLIKPAVVGDLTFAKAKYRSVQGDIVSQWRIENGTLKLDVTVPPGTTATVYVPGTGPVLSAPRGARASGMRNGRAVYEVEAGQHSFSARVTR